MSFFENKEGKPPREPNQQEMTHRLISSLSVAYNRSNIKELIKHSCNHLSTNQFRERHFASSLKIQSTKDFGWKVSSARYNGFGFNDCKISKPRLHPRVFLSCVCTQKTINCKHDYFHVNDFLILHRVCPGLHHLLHFATSP